METISNEQKAKEIAENIVGNDHYSYFDKFKQCALQAMQWKDQQFERAQDIAIGCMFSYFMAQGNSEDAINNFINAIKSQINADEEL